MSKDEMWDALLLLDISEETLKMVTAINGYTTQTMEDILYAAIGLRSFEQVEDNEND